MNKNKKKTTNILFQEKRESKIKTSVECEKCKNKCARGLNYIERMSVAGAKGNGVICYGRDR